MIAERKSIVYPACFLLLDFEERSTFHSYWITGTREKPAKKPAAKGIGKKVAPTTPSIAKKPTAAAKSVNFEKRLNSFDSNVLIKYRPEDAAAKKETRMQFAQADKNGASIDSKKPIVVKFGLNPATSLSEQVANAVQLELRAELVAEQQKVHALEERLKAANDQAAELAHTLRHLLRERAASAPVQVLAWRNLNEFEYIGGGACGKIYAAELSPQNQGQSARDVVVKFFTNLKDFLDELEAFRNAGVHRHLAELVGVVHHPAIEPEKKGTWSWALVIERYEMDLFQFVEGKKPAVALIRIMLQICQCLTHLHARGLAHCDLKPENVLIDENGHAKVADLGFTTFKKDAVARGTRHYMSPEVYAAYQHGDKHLQDCQALHEMGPNQFWESVDIFALGTTFLTLCKRSDEVSPPILQVIQRCIASNPSARPSFAKVEQQLSELMAQTGEAVEAEFEEVLTAAPDAEDCTYLKAVETEPMCTAWKSQSKQMAQTGEAVEAEFEEVLTAAPDAEDCTYLKAVETEPLCTASKSQSKLMAQTGEAVEAEFEEVLTAAPDAEDCTYLKAVETEPLCTAWKSQSKQMAQTGEAVEAEFEEVLTAAPDAEDCTYLKAVETEPMCTASKSQSKLTGEAAEGVFEEMMKAAQNWAMCTAPKYNSKLTAQEAKAEVELVPMMVYRARRC
ncbi:hypothetical protein CYMTET_44721 [Cymbomonas tetramitiformis]|uniref:Protein kinase domain-containing protein n=1 Tax=Cymbomonas tetramitiformis TaxID=36881 RepID=A0AAE0BZM7_9CHLO|nr:hypothetical protein CYMTET_44721 [Cymbomonas tetramitiformis]